MRREFFPDQAAAYANLRTTIGQGVRRLVLRGPCGFGKTLVAAAIAEGAQRKQKRVAFVVPYLSLVDQALEDFFNEGITEVGVIQGRHGMTDWSKPIQICTPQTLQNREGYPDANVVIIDEVHRLFELHRKWLADPAWQSVPFIGMSASPYTRGLGRHFDTLLIAATTQELIERGRLSKFKVFAPSMPDMSKVKVTAGEYNEKQTSEIMQSGTLTADIVDTWIERWGKDKTFFFGVDCAHAKSVQERFLSRGINFAYQDAYTPSSERREIKRKFHNGEIRGICNVETLSVGVDYDVRCLIDGQPNLSEMSFQQKIGRGLRLGDGKDHLIILDHAGNHAGRHDKTGKCTSLGFVTDIEARHDHLDIGQEKNKEDQKPQAKLPKICPKCSSVRSSGPKCTNCGHEAGPRQNNLFESDGELVELTPGVLKKKNKRGEERQYTLADKAKFYAELKAYAARHGYKNGWSYHKYAEKFKRAPERAIENVAPAPFASAEVTMWCRSRQLAWARSKKRDEVHA